ncbi:hypothetical protein L3X38_025000 [Prunus dulcis]|uniref:Uncharacterized protein n=1 Tax=Prunus dulcis TaxID=3755 RepID=A0AAD4Z5Y0_PRUDU|nr:hypothetical protein L3X38_025000 [Prunus dulcis]
MAPQEPQSPQNKQDKKQEKPKFKSIARKTISKPKPTYDQKVKHPDYVQSRCNMNPFNINFTQVKDKLNDTQKQLLQKTPFWNLIEPYYNGRINMEHMIKSDLDLVKLLKMFDAKTKSFEFGSKEFKFV